MEKRLVRAGFVALVVIAIPGIVSAELFRCQLPNGKVVFTDREEMCPGADSHTIRAKIQSYNAPTAARTPALPRRAAVPAARGTTQHPGVWREKKLRAQNDLGALEEKWDYLNQYITHCNRHRKILSQNAAGLRYEVSCKNIRREHAEAKSRMDEMRLYLDEKLEEECRRAGCLPGWIR